MHKLSYEVSETYPVFWSCNLNLGSPTHRSQTGTSLRPVRNQATQQEVSVKQVSETPSAAPHCSPSLALPPESLPFLPTLTPFVGKLSSTRPIPGAKKIANCFSTGLL